MKKFCRLAFSFLIAIAVLPTRLPLTEACGPGFLTPVFDSKYAPENPFDDFANGKIGIVKPSYHRVVLFAAYRYLNGGAFNADEQRALVDVWQADFNNKDFKNEDVAEAVKLWVERRKDVVQKEEKLPDIYTEREYGGYDFFPNCTKNAFETATRTLSDRAASYGADSRQVKEWVAGQDAVFTNCSSGKQMPIEADQTMPEWLQKDRAYQTAAARFYALDYEGAKNDFAEIAADAASPWRETAEYLVARTLIRQASLTADQSKQNAFYADAEIQLQKIAAHSGRFAATSEKFSGLIKYRLHPQERVGELAQRLALGGGNDNFRQDLIDYYWLLDKFEKEFLEREEKRKEKLKANADGSKPNADSNAPYSPYTTEESKQRAEALLKGNLIEVTIYSGNNKNLDRTYSFTFAPDVGNEEVYTTFEQAIGRTLTAEEKEQIRQNKVQQFNAAIEKRSNDYEGYYGKEKISLSIIPDFLRRDDLTDWLFAYQARDADAYEYAILRFRQTGADLWLMTALSKADKNSPEIKSLLEAAAKTSRFSPAYPTIAYHEARILVAQNRQAEARKLLDEVLESSIELPVSSRNQFLALRLNFAQTMDDFFRNALSVPFAYDLEGTYSSIDQIIEQSKANYNPEYDNESKEDYDRSIEEIYKNEKLLDGLTMLDEKSTSIVNEHFPLAVLLEARKSPVLPDYLKDRFALVVWTRALLLGYWATAGKIAPDILRLKPESENLINQFLKAASPAEKQNAALFLILKDESLAPYVAGGFGSTWENYLAGASRWWCAPFEEVYDEETKTDAPRKLSVKPKFLTPAQSAAAQNELKRLKTIGDAPKYLATRVLEWAHRSPLDRRVPESLYIVYEANGWDKYGCGGNEDLRGEAENTLKRRYPKSRWTFKLAEVEK